MGHFTTIGCRSLYQVKKTDRDRQGEESAERGCTLKQGSPSKKWRACPLQLAPYLWWLLVLPPWLPLLFQPLHLSTCPDRTLSVLFSKNKVSRSKSTTKCLSLALQSSISLVCKYLISNTFLYQRDQAFRVTHGKTSL